MMRLVIDDSPQPVPSMTWWKRSMTEAPDLGALKLRAIATNNLVNPEWSEYVTVAEQILIERGDRLRERDAVNRISSTQLLTRRLGGKRRRRCWRCAVPP